MALLDGVGIAVLACCALLVALVARRRLLARRGARVEISLRQPRGGGRSGWTYGLGRYASDSLEWYRVFSFALRPRCTIRRSGLRVRGQRRPEGAEAHAVVGGAVLLSCVGPQGEVELAMPEQEVTGFLAWVEGGPPDPRNVVL